MSKLSLILFLMSHLYSFSQKNEIDSIYIYVDKNTKHLESSFTKDSSSVNFCIFLKEYETATLRLLAKKKYARTQKGLYPLPPLRKPLEFCNVFESYGKPIVLHNINSIKYMTPDEFRDGNRYARYMFVIYKIRDDCYWKWRIFIGG